MKRLLSIIASAEFIASALFCALLVIVFLPLVLEAKSVIDMICGIIVVAFIVLVPISFVIIDYITEK